MNICQNSEKFISMTICKVNLIKLKIEKVYK